MKTLLGLLVTSGTLTLALAACSGNVVVDSPGGSGSGASTTTTNTITLSTTSSGACSPTCNVSITTGGPAPCSNPGLNAYQLLQSCACVSGSECAAQCGANFCAHTPISMDCANCLNTSCLGNYQICTTN